MPNEENLKPCQKGSTNNPNGRPKGVRNRSTIVKYWLEAETSFKNPISGKEEIISLADQITIALISKARKGDVQAFRELMDSGFGKVLDKLEAKITNNEPIRGFIIKEVTKEEYDARSNAVSEAGAGDSIPE